MNNYNNIERLTEGINSVTVTGVLAQNNLRYGELTKGQQQGTPYINGSIEVKVSDNESHIINFFEVAKFKNGNDNKAFMSLKSLLDSQVMSVADMIENGVSDTQPSIVRVSGGSLSYNMYSTRQGEFKEFPEITGRFVSVLKPNTSGTTPNLGATFHVEVLIDEVQKVENTEKAEAVVKAYNFNFLGQLTPMEFKFYDAGAQFVTTQDVKGKALFLHGHIRNYFKGQEEVLEMTGGFGDSLRTYKSTTVKEWEVVGGKPTGKPNNYNNKELLDKAIKDFNDYRERIKQEAEAKKNANNGSNNSGAFGQEMNDFSQGFGTFGDTSSLDTGNTATNTASDNPFQDPSVQQKADDHLTSLFGTLEK